MTEVFSSDSALPSASLSLLQRAADDQNILHLPKFEVELSDWKGPYDVLLEVIEQKNLNLLDLDIFKLLEGYLEFLKNSESISLDDAGEFLVVAATLAQIKSRLLLPKDERIADEEEKDPRAELVKYLMEYQKIKQAAAMLRERPLLGRDVFVKGASEMFQGAETEGRGTLFQLVKGFQKIMRGLNAKIPMEFEHEQVSVSDRFHEVFQYLKKNKRGTFLEILAEHRSKLYVIVTFLSILELVRLKKIHLQQADVDLPLFLEYVEGAEDDLDHSEFDERVDSDETLVATETVELESEPTIEPEGESAIEPAERVLYDG